MFCINIASIGNYVGSRTVKKIFPISKSMIATMAGGAADCAYWIRRISRQMKILEFEYGSEFSVKATAKFMANTLRDYRGNGTADYYILNHTIVNM